LRYSIRAGALVRGVDEVIPTDTVAVIDTGFAGAPYKTSFGYNEIAKELILVIMDLEFDAFVLDFHAHRKIFYFDFHHHSLCVTIVSVMTACSVPDGLYRAVAGVIRRCTSVPERNHPLILT
jgi:hypothetical protein